MSGAEIQTNRPRRGDEIELTIDRLAHGGAGVARTDGYVVFVRGAVPGDRVRARVGKSKRSFAEADTVELLEPSPDRVEPVAPHPGAPWQVLPYDCSCARRRTRCATRWRASGASRTPPVEPIVPALEPLRYRNKLEYSFGEDDEGELVLGFHRPGRFDAIDDVTLDILASERVDELREAVKGWCRAEGLRRGIAEGISACCATSWCARGAAPGSCRRGWSRAPARASAWTSWPPPRRPTASSGRARRAWRRPRARARPRW